MKLGKWQAALFIFAAALLVRLAMIGVWYHTGQDQRMIASDGFGYYEIAQNLAEGQGFKLEGKPTLRRVPLYPLFIALTDKGLSFPKGVQAAQAFLGAMSCVVIFFLGRELWNEKVGWIASLLYALDYLAIRQVASVMPEILFVFLLLGSVWLMVRSQNRCRIFPDMVVSGILAGLAVLTKEVMVFYFILLGAWFFWGFKKQAAGVFLLGFFLAITPWVVRNRVVFGQWGLVMANAGHMLYLGNNPLISSRFVGEEWDYNGDSGFPQNDPSMPRLFTPEADHYLSKKSLVFIRNHPKRFFQLTKDKIIRFWFPFYLGSPPLGKVLTLLTYLSVFILGWMGIFKSVPRWKEMVPMVGPIIYLASVYAVTISGIRYRYPAMPFLTLFAAYMLRRLWESRVKKVSLVSV